MIDLWQTIIDGAKVCHACGTQNFKGRTYCVSCGERIVNRNPVVRFFVTVAALGVVGAVVWWNVFA